MEAFEPIRKAAASLHARVKGDGKLRPPPMALAMAALAHLDLGIAWLPAGDPALKGAKALLDEQSGTIFAEDHGAASARALVLAHEIGHAVIHAGSTTCAEHDVDPSRSTESAPVGLQRVEDYGARERRELQANVFAREFLLPRALAFQMFVAEKMSAAEIAKQLDLPVPLVRQQILDVVLLPPPSEAPREGPKQSAYKADPAQDRAAAHRGAPFLLEAGPGTGKTSTLVKRVVSLLEEGVDAASILLLTFSNRATGELSERIALAVPEKAAKVWIGTFHAFGLDLLRRHYDVLGLPSDPTLFDRSDAIAVLEDILPTLPLAHYRDLWDPARILREVLGAISRAKDELTGPEDYRLLAEAMLKNASDEETQVAAQKSLEIAEIYAQYEKAKTEHGAVDFGDLIMRPAKLLESASEVRIAIQLRHRHVLVDEYQDVNRASVRLLKALVGDGKRMWVVGDARQSIYRFRGASSINMRNFVNEFPSAVRDQLTLSYRSTQRVVNAFSAFAAGMSASQGMLPLKLVATRGEGLGRPVLQKFDSDDQEAAGIAAAIRELESAGVSLRDQAVLCRSNRRLNEVAQALEVQDIPVLHLGSLFEREEIRDLLAILSFAADRFGDALVRIAAHPSYAVPLQDVYLVLRQLREDDGPASAPERLADVLDLDGLSQNGKNGLGRLAQDLAGLNNRATAWDFITTYLLDRTDRARQLATPASVRERMSNIAIWQFLNFLREESPLAYGPPIRRTLDRVRQLVLLAEERDLRQVPAAGLETNAVRLMTVHGSKGLEFEAVHVPSLTKTSFPAAYRGQRCPPPVDMVEGVQGLSVAEEAKRSHAEEEECLFFVALSRARTHLRLTLARHFDSGRKRSASDFLERIPSPLLTSGASPKITAAPIVDSGATAIVNYPADWRLTNAKLELYGKCPRRFFYTHVLGLGAAKRATAFSRTHDCLYRLISWLSDRRAEAATDQKEVESEFDRIWREHGPTDHGFAEDYRRLALRLIGALVQAGRDVKFRKAESLMLDLPNGRIVVEPNEIAERANGAVVLRRVRTGYRRQDEYDRLDYALYRLAGQQNFGRNVSVEAIHLTDETHDPVEITDKKLGNRRAEADAMLAKIGAGAFSPSPDPVVCPRCPHFFLCPALPSAPLAL